jgi:hypothetical protein
MAVYAHFFAGLVLVEHASSVPFLRRRDRPVRQLAISVGVILLLLVPAIVLALAGPRDQLSWLPRPGIKAALGQPMHLAGGAVLALIFLPLLASAGASAWATWRVHGRSHES